MTTLSSLLIIACVLISYLVHCGHYHYQQQVPNPYHRRQHPHWHHPHYYYRKPTYSRPHHQFKPARFNPVPIAAPVTAVPAPAVRTGVVQQPHQQQSVVDVLMKNKDRYSTLISAVQKVKLVDTLSKGGPFTIFAPTNEAFNALPEGALAKLLDSPEELRKVLLGHVSSGNYPVALILTGDLPSLNGASHRIVVTTNKGAVTVDEANVIGQELVADNGVIHTIDRVLLPQSKPQTIVDVLVENSDTYSTLITAVKSAQLVDTLSTGGPFTLFAPTNDAFDALPDGALAKLLATPEDLKKVLLGHVSSGNYTVALIRSGDLPSLLDEVSNKIALSETGAVTVERANVIGNELIADNGVIHTIDQVILHPKKQSIVDILAEKSNTYSTLITAVKAVDLIETLSTGGPFTLFAPTNAAFDALPDGALTKLLDSPADLKKVLLGHFSSGNYPVALIRSGDLLTLDEESKKVVVLDQGVIIGSSNVIGKELIADNGVIHTIDRVILPSQQAPAKSQSIVDILIKNEETYSTLITAVKAVELVDTLYTGGPFTLFAPTNEAFAALPKGALGKLLAAPEELKKVLLGHVVSGSLPVALVRSGDLTALSGSVINVDTSVDGVKIDEANVIGNEFIADNGVIHTIDKVLFPAPAKRQSIVDVLIENTDTYSTLITAAKAANLVETLSNDAGPFTLFAPTNEAFAALSEGSLTKLLASPEDLKKVLLGHVLSGNYPVAVMRNGDPPTLNGGKINVSINDDGVTVNGAKVINKEFIADNGVIHTIDKVLLS